MDGSLKIGLIVSTLWASIGTFVALELNASLWWLGLLFRSRRRLPDLRLAHRGVGHPARLATGNLVAAGS